MKILDENIALVNDGDVTHLAGAKPAGNFMANRALLSVLTGIGAFTLVPATTPSTTVGHPVEAGVDIELTSQEEIEGFRIVQIGSEALTIYATYFFENSKV